jgi:glutathione S-transferase
MTDTIAMDPVDLRIYHRVKAGRPLRVLWTLEEIGRPYELVTMTAEQAAQDEHLARHPLGRVPVIDAGDGPMFESAGLCLHLADLHPEAGLLAPVGTHERGLAYQWAFFAMTEIEPAIVERHRVGADHPDLAEQARARAARAVDAVTAALERSGPYLVGPAFSVADIVAGEVVRLAVRSNAVEPSEGLTAYLDALKSRPARERAQAAAHR